MKTPLPTTILYVEDDESDVLLLKFALTKAHITSTVKTVKNGEEAVAYLKGTGKYADRTRYPLPGLLLLDLNLPRFPGMKLLQWIRGQRQFSSLPVVIYTSAENPAEIKRARELGANDFIVKPAGLPETLSVVQKLKKRWLQHSC